MNYFFLISFLFGFVPSSLIGQSDNSKLADQFLLSVESQANFSDEFVNIARDLRDIFDESLEVEADEIMIRVLRFENSILFDKARPLLEPNDVLLIKNKFPSKDLHSAKLRALALIKKVVP